MNMQNLLGFFKYGGRKNIFLSIALILTQIISHAQTQYYVNINLVQVIAPYSSNLSDYVSNPSKVIISLQMVAGGPSQNIKLFATIKGDNGIQIKTNINALSSLPEINLSSVSPSLMVNALDIRNVFDLDYVDVTGTTLSNLQTNGLPAGNYQLCVQAVAAVANPTGGQAAGSPASLEACSRSFTISPPTASVAVRTLQVIAPYSNKLSDYLNNPSRIIITLYSNSTYKQIYIKLLATLKGDNGIQIITNVASLDLLQEINISSGINTLVLNASSISNLFNLEGVTIQGTTSNDLLNGNGLPAGNYQLCITPVEATTDPATGQQAGKILADQSCSNSFTINPLTASVSIRNVQVIYPYSTHLSDFLNNPSKVIITLGSNITYPQFKIKLLATLKGDNGIQITTNPNNLNLLPEITLISGQPVVVLNASSINNLFNVEGVTLHGMTYNELVNGNGLPEGNYQLCITPVVAETNASEGVQAGQVLSDAVCSNPIAITNLEPPVIINPLSGSDILSRNPQNIIFNWSIPAGVKGSIQYDFKIVEIQDSLRNPNDAMQSATNPAFFERTVNANVILFGPGEPPLTPGYRYAFMVTAIDPQNNVIFRNGGRSEVAYFFYKPDTSHNALIVNNNNQITDTSQNKNPISVMDAPELNCSCKMTISDKTVDNSNAKSGSIVHVGKFDMTLNNDVAVKGDSISGTGTIPVPFLNSSLLKIKVEFSNLKVNSSNQAVSGTVKAKRNANAVSVLPAVDPPNTKPTPFTASNIQNIGNYINNNASTAIADVKNSINSAGWEMPFGIQKEISGEKIVVAITDMVFAPDQAGFNACLAFDIPEGGGNNTLALGAKNICFKDSKSLCSDATLFLVEDFKIDALNFTFIKATGNNNSQAGTYAIFDTSGFKKLHIKAEYDFSQNVIVKKADKGIVKATIETDIQSWNNWYANVNIDTFSIAGYDEWSFALKAPAYYDHSDSINPPGLPKDSIAGKKNFLDKSWHGFFMSDLQASLPAILKRADKKPILIDVKNFMIDNQGITGM